MLATDDNFSIPMESHKSSIGPFGLSDIRWILRRGWLFPIAGALIGLMLALTFVAFMPQLYTSTARILVDRSVNRFLQSTKILDQPTLDDVDMAGQFYVLSSDSIIIPVIRSLNLTRDPEFVGRSALRAAAGEADENPCATSFGGPCISYAIGEAKNFFKRLIGWRTASPLDPETLLERTAAETFLRRLRIERGDVNNVISISFSSEDPTKAAKIANAIATTYIEQSGERKVASNKLVNQFLEDRLLETKQQSINADRALQEFKAANNLTGVATVDNPLISRLRSEYVDLERKANDIAEAVGPDHMAVAKLRKQMDALNAAIRAETERVSGTEELSIVDPRAEYHNIEEDLAPAAPSEELRARLQKLDSAAQAKYRDLDFTAHTLRVLYHTDLRKFDELNQTRPDTEDAHIITKGAPPLRKDSNKSMLVLGGGIVFGFLSGIGLVIGREWAAGVYRTPEQVTRDTGAYCVILPTVDMRKRGRLDDYVLDAPYSRYTEAIRKVRASMRAYPSPNADKVIGVVSSVANEGKTTVAHNFASLLSAYSKCKTLIIDCDLHRRNLTAELAPDARQGLLEALDDPSQLEKYISKRERSGVDVLPCALSERNPNVAELLGSAQMQKLIAVARENYDFIIIEIAPIVSVVDIKMIEHLVDKFIFVIEWGKTKRSLVEEALSEADVIRDRISCMILNKADPATLRTIESYKGRRIAEYFVE
ncbi:GumC family protein [Hyphomicrobium facile]|nr:polysaccharide biosynthesis tyrosine autokinase [Hyphomicrobium facile]